MLSVGTNTFAFARGAPCSLVTRPVINAPPCALAEPANDVRKSATTAATPRTPATLFIWVLRVGFHELLTGAPHTDTEFGRRGLGSAIRFRELAGVNLSPAPAVSSVYEATRVMRCVVQHSRLGLRKGGYRAGTSVHSVVGAESVFRR